MERTIEARLREDYKYSDDQIEQFLKSFVDNMPKYKQKDPEAVETLYGFIDFQKFKNTMVTYKKGMIDSGDTKRTSEEQQIQSTAGSSTEEAFEIFQDLLNEPLSSWSKKLDSDEFATKGIKFTIHQRQNPGSSTDMLRVDSTLKGIKKEALVKYFLDPPPG
jgi:hypothetical protein